jgi:hypothetical protein
VIFDRRTGAAPIEERLMTELATTTRGRNVTIVRG